MLSDEYGTVSIRPAREADDGLIKQMIREARLDPTSLKWANFLIAEVDGEMVGIGQVKPYPGCRELGSLVVKLGYRKLGIGGMLIDALEARSEYPIYLLCMDTMEAYYQRFGYETISFWQAPTFLKLKLMIPQMLQVFGWRVLVMRKDTPPNLPPIVE